MQSNFNLSVIKHIDWKESEVTSIIYGIAK